jgi:hypothetical protein
MKDSDYTYETYIDFEIDVTATIFQQFKAFVTHQTHTPVSCGTKFVKMVRVINPFLPVHVRSWKSFIACIKLTKQC